jgi:hypothetical protein
MRAQLPRAARAVAEWLGPEERATTVAKVAVSWLQRVIDYPALGLVLRDPIMGDGASTARRPAPTSPQTTIKALVFTTSGPVAGRLVPPSRPATTSSR